MALSVDTSAHRSAHDKDLYSPFGDSADIDALLGHVTGYHSTDTSSWRQRFLRLLNRRAKQRPYEPATSQHGFCIRSWVRFGVRLGLYFFTTFAIISILNGLLRPSYSNPPLHYKSLERRIRTSQVPGRGNPYGEKVYVASNIINEDLIRGPWGRSLLSLIDLLGEDKVFVSIYENDSGNATVAALHNLHDSLPCNSSVVTGDHLSLDSFPTMRLPDDDDRVQRLTYLSEVRNRLLWPLDASRPSNLSTGLQSAAATRFDKILFINDVYFDPVEAVQLLFSTNAQNGRAEYRAACALDFVRGAQLYDTFVVRDTEGFGTGFMLYPWFSTLGRGASRLAVLQQKDAVPVRSCWGGMVAFDASVFQDHRSTERSPKIPESASSKSTYPALSFHGSNESFWEAAECCLVFADIEERYGKPDNEEGTGVFINPHVRVAYSQSTWCWLPVFRRFERAFQYVQYIFSYVNYPDQNPRRTHEPGELVEETVWNSSIARFEHVQRRAVPGGFCGQRKMFVMRSDLERANTDGSGKNWKKVPVPPGAD